MLMVLTEAFDDGGDVLVSFVLPEVESVFEPLSGDDISIVMVLLNFGVLRSSSV